MVDSLSGFNVGLELHMGYCLRLTLKGCAETYLNNFGLAWRKLLARTLVIRRSVRKMKHSMLAYINEDCIPSHFQSRHRPVS